MLPYSCFSPGVRDWPLGADMLWASRVARCAGSLPQEAEIDEDEEANVVVDWDEVGSFRCGKWAWENDGVQLWEVRR